MADQFYVHSNGNFGGTKTVNWDDDLYVTFNDALVTNAGAYYHVTSVGGVVDAVSPDPGAANTNNQLIFGFGGSWSATKVIDLFNGTYTGPTTPEVGIVTVTINPVAPDTNITATLSQNGSPLSLGLIEGTNTVNCVVGSGTSGESYRVRALATSSNGSASVTNCGSSATGGTIFLTYSATPANSEIPAFWGETRDYKMQAQRPPSIGGDNLWDDTNVTFTLSQLVGAVTVAPTVSYAATQSSTTTATVNWTQTNPYPAFVVKEYALSNSVNDGDWQTSNTFAVTRGTSYEFWVRFRNTTTNLSTGVALRDNVASTAPYLDADTSISLSPTSVNLIDASNTTNIVVSISGGSTPSRYKLVTVGSSSLGASGTLVGTAIWPDSQITISNPSECPVEGETITYKSQSRVTVGDGGTGVWQDTNDTIVVSRGGVLSADITVLSNTQGGGSVSTSTVGPGSNLPVTVLATVASPATINDVYLAQDNDFNGSYVYNPLSSEVISGTGTTSASCTGILVYNATGLSSGASYRYKGTALNSDNETFVTGDMDFTINAHSTGATPTNQNYGTNFSVTVTNTLSYFDYCISTDSQGTVNSNLAFPAATNPTGILSSVLQGTGGNLLFTGITDPGAGSGPTTYYVWFRRRTNTDNKFWGPATSFQRTPTAGPTMGTTTISPSSGTGAGITVTITGSATAATGQVINDITVVSGTGAIVPSETPSGEGTQNASITATFNSLDVDDTYDYKVEATDDLAQTTTSNGVTYQSQSDGNTGGGGPTDGLYGLEVYNSTGDLIWDTSSRVGRYLNSGSGGLAGNNQTVQQDFAGALPGGYVQDGTETVIFLDTTGTAQAEAPFDYTYTLLGNNSLRVSVTFPDLGAEPGDFSFTYWIFKS